MFGVTLPVEVFRKYCGGGGGNNSSCLPLMLQVVLIAINSGILKLAKYVVLLFQKFIWWLNPLSALIEYFNAFESFSVDDFIPVMIFGEYQQDRFLPFTVSCNRYFNKK